MGLTSLPALLPSHYSGANVLPASWDCCRNKQGSMSEASRMVSGMELCGMHSSHFVVSVILVGFDPVVIAVFVSPRVHL